MKIQHANATALKSITLSVVDLSVFHSLADSYIRWLSLYPQFSSFATPPSNIR